MIKKYALGIIAALAMAGSAPAQQASPFATTALPPGGNGAAIRALLVADTESVLSSQIAGRIIRIGVSHGQRFKKGQPLIKFDCEVTRADMQKVRAELTAASKTYESNLQLQRHKAISTLEVEVSKAQVDKAKADVARIRALLRMCEIKAPFTGRVVKINVHAYETVTQGQPLIEILDDSRLKMQVYVPSSWLQWLKQGTAFQVRIDETGQTYPAKVTALGARVDPVSQTLEIEAVVEGKYKNLLAGMSGVAHFDTP